MSTTVTVPRRSRYGRRTWGRATDLGFDSTDGPWVVTCEDHGVLVNVQTSSRARITGTDEFCEECAR